MYKNGQQFIPAKIFLEMGGWRPPLLMVDKITGFTRGDKGSIQVIKHVTYNDPYLAGHFPEDPVMPGAIIAEIYGQASEYFSFLSDICAIYQELHGKELRTLRDICAHIHDTDMLAIIRQRRKQVHGVLASQNLKFKGIVWPGDTIEVSSKIEFTDDNGFVHYAVSARTGKRVIGQGTIINYREIIQ